MEDWLADKAASESPKTLENTDYIYLRKIGQSHLGEVWQVKSKTSDCMYTLKKITKTSIAKYQNQFLRELSTLYRTSHPNIVKIVSHFEDQEFLYIVMESIEGITLTQKIAIEGQIEESKAVDIWVKIIEAVEYLHNLSPPVIYKYIKPDNIVIDLCKGIKLIDFCWASLSSEEDTTENHISTLEYLAPEILDKGEFTKSIDIWCLGVLLYEIIFGKSPFKSNSIGLLYDIQNCKVSYPENIDPKLQELLSKILVKDFNSRPSLSELKNSEWVISKTRKILEEKTEQFERETMNEAVQFLVELKGKQVEEINENKEKVRDLNTEICWLREKIGKIEEKIVGVQGSNEKIDMEIKEGKRKIEETDEFLGNAEENVEFWKEQVQVLQKRVERINETYQFWEDVKAKRRVDIEMLENNIEEMKEHLKPLKRIAIASGFATQNPSFPIIFEEKDDELEFFNMKSKEQSQLFEQSSERIGAKIEDLRNLAYLKERSICELELLYQEKVKEISECHKISRNSLFYQKTKENSEISQKLQQNSEEYLNQVLEDEKKSESLFDPRLYAEKKAHSHALSKEILSVSQQIKLKKREILKLKVVKYKENEKILSKKAELANLIEVLMNKNLSLDIDKVRRLI